MSGTKAEIYKEINRVYEKDREEADKLQAARLQELYEKIPRVLEIDRSLSETGLAITKAILKNPRDRLRSLAELEEKNKVYITERQSLIKQAGYKEDYFVNTYKCAVCRDTGFIGGERCKCLKQRLIEKYYQMSNLGEVLEKENFEAFNINYYSNDIDPKEGVSPQANMQINWNLSLRFINNFEDKSKHENLLMYGRTGLGKTFLCNCIARELLDRGKTVVYSPAVSLFKKVEDVRFSREEQDAPRELLEYVYSADLLIIDDLGTEFITLVTSSELFNIINSRLLAGKACIISTNLTPTELKNQYTDRLTSRIFGNFNILKFFGEDIRVTKNLGGY